MAQQALEDQEGSMCNARDCSASSKAAAGSDGVQSHSMASWPVSSDHEAGNYVITYVFEANEVLKIQLNIFFQGICFIFLFIGVKKLRNDHTP
jgi:hypothetical protein